MSESSKLRVVILGGGIIGLSTAYYLLSAESPAKVTLIEKHSPAHGASGRAAGLIFDSWHAGHILPLAKLSYDCHEQLSRLYDGKETWGWQEVNVYGMEVSAGAKMSKMRTLPKPAKRGERDDVWNGSVYDLGGRGRLASLNAKQFCENLLHQSLKLGLDLQIGEPTSLDASSRSLTYRSNDTQCSLQYDKLLLAAGPWTAPLARQLGLKEPRISNLPGHSIVIYPSQPLPDRWRCTSIFAGVDEDAEVTDAIDEEGSLGDEERDSECTPSIELVVRPDGSVYLAGENTPSSREMSTTDHEENNLPLDPSEIEGQVDQRLIDRLLRSAGRTSPALNIDNGARLEISQLCYRPTSEDGTPLLGHLEGHPEGVFVAGGHGPWGITLGPGSGKLMSEMILSLPTSVNPQRFDPSRFG